LRFTAYPVEIYTSEYGRSEWKLSVALDAVNLEVKKMDLVTGGTGFIGSWLTKMLIEEGSRVATFSRAKGGDHSILRCYETEWSHFSGSLERMSDVFSAIKKNKPKIIYHVGGMLSAPSEENPQASFATNVAGMFHVLESARLFGVKRVVYASTNGTYGIDLDGVSVIDDRTLQRPITVYGCGKLFGELLGRYYHNRYGIDFRSVRLPAVVGPGSKTRHLSVYIAWAIEKSFFGEPFDVFVTPETVMPFIYFKDAARALLEIAQAPPGQIKTMNYNLIGIEPIPTAMDVKNLILRFLPQARLGFDPDPVAMAYQKRHQGVQWDETPAVKEWNWKIGYDLEDLVADFILELKGHPSWYR
jgi:threonine 3-dehydrogenase